MSRRLATMIAAVALTSGSVFAQGAGKHKEKAVQGEVVSSASDRFELKTETGIIPVTFSSNTKFQHGSGIVDKTHVTKSAQVSVVGLKLPSGEFVARKVLIRSSSYHSHHVTGKETPPKGTQKKFRSTPD